MATFNTQFVPSDKVWYVDTATGIHRAVVKRVDIEVTTPSATGKIKYDIQFTVGAKTVNDVEETTLFSDIDLALADYKVFLLTTA